MTAMRTINIGLIGLGTVGMGLVKALKAKRPILKQRMGLDLNLRLVAEKNWARKRDVRLPASMRC